MPSNWYTNLKRIRVNIFVRKSTTFWFKKYLCMVLFMHLRWFLGLVVNFGSGCFKPSQTKSDSVYPVAQTPRTSEKNNSETLQNARKHDIKTCGCFLFVFWNYDKVFCTLDFVYTLSARINFYYYVLYALYFVLDDFF